MRKDMGIGPGRILMAPELDGTFYEIGQKVWIFGGAWSSPYLKIITEVLDHQYAHPVKKTSVYTLPTTPRKELLQQQELSCLPLCRGNYRSFPRSCFCVTYI